MKISSVRLGFANNSSSTHSIIINAGKLTDNQQDLNFGWENFTLSSPHMKRAYMAATIYTGLRSQLGQHIAKLVVKDITDFEIPEEGDELDCYVDHQSRISIPVRHHREYDPVVPEFEFLHELTETVVENPKFAILGGNDNSEGHPLHQSSEIWPTYRKLPLEHRFGEIIARRDFDHWTLFNTQTGAKIRLSFKSDKELHAGETPELVDICITKQCFHGCKFCYQDATRDGVHAKKDDISFLLYKLSEADVFEVALGGGEPVRHPDFVEILKDARTQGIVPNFTTADSDWIYDKNNTKIADAVRKYCGSFAISLTDYHAVKAVAKWNDSDERVKATLQIPMGCFSWEQVSRALNQAEALGIPVTLLGYKKIGRANKFKKQEYKQIVDWMSEKHYFGADTLFVEEFDKELKEIGVSPILVADKEGRFSCYIDAVNKTIGKHSYGAKMKPLNKKDVFEDFPYTEEK